MKDFKGKFTDTSYLKNPEGTWQDARNILLTEQFNSPVNENGSKFNHLIDGVVIGVIETNQEIVYFSKVPTSIYNLGYNSIISIYNYTTQQVTVVMRGNFNFNRPIEGIYKYNFEGSLIVVWADGVFNNSNTPKIAKITNLDLPLVNGILEEVKIPLIELFPDISQGNIEGYSDEGNIDGIVAFLTFKYGRGNEETVFKTVNTYASLEEISEVSNQISKKGIRVELTELDYTLYDYIKIGVYVVGDTFDKSYSSRRIPISSSTETVSINSILDYDEIADTEILIPKGFFNKIESLTLHKDSILGLNANTPNIFKFQKYANMLNIVPRLSGLTRPPSIAPDIEYNPSERHLMYNEVYSFNVQCELKDGTISDWFHIPNLDYTQDELATIWGTSYETDYELELNKYLPSEFKPQFHLVNKGTYDRFGLWMNKSTYPNNDEYDSTIDYDGSVLAGQDLKGKTVSFHRVMEEERANTGLDIKNSYVVSGAMITNFDVVPIAVRKKIRNVRIGIVKRNFGNSLVIAEGLVTPASPQEKLEATSYANNDRSHLVNMTPIMASTAYREANFPGMVHNQFCFFSPEVEEVKPSLNINALHFKRLILATKSSPNKAAGIRSEAVDVDLGITYKDGGDHDKEFNQNKYYNKPFSYNYKLPNNPSQGSKFVDGGLFINNETSINNYLNTDDGFLPIVAGGDTPFVANPKLITITTTHYGAYNFSVSGSIVALMSFKDNLYTLQEQNIIASKNSLALVNDSLPSPFDRAILFKIGDVSYSKISGSLAYTVVNNTSFINYSNCTINVKIASAFASSFLSIKDSIEEDGEIYSPENTEDLIILEGKIYGYEVTGNSKNSTTNSFAGFPTLDIFKTYLDKFPFRIIRSSLTPDESFIINSLRTFFASNYKELKSGKGDGVAIRANDNEVYIQMRYTLLYAKVKDVLTTSDADIALQTRDIFENEPVSLSSKPRGQIGSEHKFACVLTKVGYLTIDHLQGAVILASPQVNVITQRGVRNEFIGLLEFEKQYREDVNGISKAIDNPYENIGFSIGVDEKYNRLYVSKLYPSSLSVPFEGDRDAYYDELIEQPTPDLSTPIEVENDKSFTQSFSLDANFWLCSHDFTTSKYIEFKNRLYALKNLPISSYQVNKGVIHELNTGKKGVYFGKQYESFIDLIFNAESAISKSLYNVSLITESFLSSSIADLSITKKTISKLAVFNYDQSSGELVLDLDNKDIIRLAEGTYKINNLRDLVINPNLPIFIKGDKLDINNLNFNKIWFDKSYFIGKFIVVRLIWDNATQHDVFVNEVQVQSKISKR
tara:strand:+ start:4241 stop:8146 length:3906 start_codon:yes stop_codon:yes gene_type:complete